MKKLYVHTKNRRPDGTYDCYGSIQVPTKETGIPRKGQTATGYGSAIPTPYLVLYNSRWQRVKAICYSNAAKNTILV